VPEREWRLLLSCEHGGNRVPPEYEELFAGAEAILQTHRGYDIGIAPFARRLAKDLQAPLQLAEVTRLLVDLNRSPAHPALFSEFSRQLGKRERERMLADYYHPYRKALIGQIEKQLAVGRNVCHVSLHSFTPELNGKVRNADIGLLYDPRRTLERRFSLIWREELLGSGAGWRVRRNYPYRGAADSLVTCLRRRYPEESYLGMELELNQSWPLRGSTDWERLQQLLSTTLKMTLAKWNHAVNAPAHACR